MARHYERPASASATAPPAVSLTAPAPVSDVVRRRGGVLHRGGHRQRDADHACTVAGMAVTSGAMLQPVTLTTRPPCRGERGVASAGVPSSTRRASANASAVEAAAVDRTGAGVAFIASATDLVDGAVAVSCGPLSGSTFSLGRTTVTCSASDARGNRVQRSFDVTVVDGTPPIVTVPPGITREATNAAGAQVAFIAGATDNVAASLTPSCAPGSGATFPIGATRVTCSATDAAGNTGEASFTVTIVDTTPPTVAYTGNAGSYTVDQMVNIQCTATDGGSGVAATTCADITAPAFSFAVGMNAFSASATDRADNTGHATTSFTVVVPTESLQTLVSRFCINVDVADGLNAKLAAAARAPNANARAGQLGAFENQVRAHAGKALSADQAATLLRLVAALY